MPSTYEPANATTQPPRQGSEMIMRKDDPAESDATALCPGTDPTRRRKKMIMEECLGGDHLFS